MRPLRIRTRLVLGASIVGGVLIAVALGVARVEIADQLRDTSASLARADLASYIADLETRSGESPDPAANGELVLVRDPSGVESVDTMPHDVRLALPSVATDGRVSEFGDDEGRSYVIVSATVPTPRGTWSLWAARDASTSRAALRGIDVVFAVVGVVLLGAMVGASWFLTRRSLRAVDVLRARAATLRGDELLPLRGTGDEIDELAATLNGLVGSVRASAARERQMVSDAAHELRTPIAGLRAELELLQRTESGSAPGLASARRSAERLSELATNLLELSRLDESPRAAGAVSGASLSDAVLETVDRARSTVAGTAVEIREAIGVADGDAIYGLSVLGVGRIVDNLVSNAVRSVAGAGVITITVTDDPTGIALTVEDDGGGMPDDLLPRAFDRFTRGADAAQDGGAGLGLALVAALVRSADGEVTARNLDGGLRVEVRLPKM